MNDLPPPRPAVFRKYTILVSLGLIAGYMGVRTIIYFLYPSTNPLQWLVRDTMMNAPRLFFLFLCWRYAGRLWTLEGLGLHRKKVIEGVVLGLLFCTPLFARPFFFPILGQPWASLTLLCLSSIIVGCFEEVLFRGLLFRAIYDHHGPKLAIWGSTLAFVFFHLRAQPYWNFPNIFIFGLCFGLMRASGVSLTALIAVHALYGIVAVSLRPIGDYPPFWTLSHFLVVAYVTGMYWAAYRIKLLKPVDTFRPEDVY